MSDSIIGEGIEIEEIEAIYHFIVFIGNANAGKSTLIKKLTSHETNVTAAPNFFKHDKFDFYELNTEEIYKTVYVDVGGFSFKATDQIKLAGEIFKYGSTLKENLIKSFKEHKKLDATKKYEFLLTVNLLNSNGNISNTDTVLINFMERNDINWYLLISKFDERIQSTDTDEQIRDMKEKRKSDIYENFGKFSVDYLNSKCFFISSKKNEENRVYNDLLLFKQVLDGGLNYNIPDSLKEENIAFVVTGGGNIGKSSFINRVFKSNVAACGEGIVSKSVKIYDFLPMPCIKIYDCPGKYRMNTYYIL